jgi:hypothetical protein
MSATDTSIVPKGTRSPGSRRWLWLICGTAPLLLLAVLVDIATGRRLAELLPLSPMGLPGYAVIFGMPHILASFFAFADPALARSSAHILKPSLTLAALATVLIAPFGMSAWGMSVIIGATMIHVLGQQTGLSVGRARLASSRLAQVWKVLLAAMGCAAALAIGGEGGHLVVERPEQWLTAAGLLLMLATPLAAWLTWRARAHGGDYRILIATHVTAVSGYVMAASGYAALGIALFRVIHDATAFSIYADLANAREIAAPGANRLYRVFGIAGRRPGPWLWLIAMVMAAAFASVLPPAVMLWLVFAHYLAEKRLWRHGSPLRQAMAR